MSILVIHGQECTLAASRAAPWWATLSMRRRCILRLDTIRDRQTDGRTVAIMKIINTVSKIRCHIRSYCWASVTHWYNAWVGQSGSSLDSRFDMLPSNSNCTWLLLGLLDDVINYLLDILPVRVVEPPINSKLPVYFASVRSSDCTQWCAAARLSTAELSPRVACRDVNPQLLLHCLCCSFSVVLHDFPCQRRRLSHEQEATATQLCGFRGGQSWRSKCTQYCFKKCKIGDNVRSLVSKNCSVSGGFRPRPFRFVRALPP